MEESKGNDIDIDSQPDWRSSDEGEEDDEYDDYLDGDEGNSDRRKLVGRLKHKIKKWDWENSPGNKISMRLFSELDKPLSDGNTVIHILLEHAEDDQLEFFRPLLTLVLESDPRHLLKTDDIGETPLHLSVRRRLLETTKLLCESVDPPTAQAAIAELGPHRGNCLHAAVRRDAKIALYLASRADTETLVQRDRNLNTPLHSAVEYSSCTTAEQLALVEYLVDKCSKPLEMLNKSNLSPYRYHCSSRTTYIESKLGRVKGGDRTKPKPSMEKDGNLFDRPRSRIEPANEKTMKPLGHPDIATRRPIGESGQTAERKSPSASQVERQAPNIRSPLERVPAPGVVRASTKGSKTTDKSKEMEKWAKEIENFLKLYCIRHFSPDTVGRLLYEPGHELELTFDLTGASHISTGMLENLERFLKFDEILQLVAFPAFPDKDNREGVFEKSRPEHRWVFDWLRKMGVRRILHLVVNDMVDSPQSDSAIENALRGLDIEELDWKREDICSESIRRAIPDVLILHLYCSGRNPVLRAWSGSDGLVTLPKLRKTTLICRTGLESEDRTDKNIYEFTERLKQSFHHVERHIKISTALGGHESEAIREPMDPVQLKPTSRSAMLEISDALRMFEKVKSSHPVKVALVCDGVDVARRRLVDCITSGTSLDSFADSGAIKPWFLSSRDYGSQMATLIADVCPSARMYILRIETAAEDPKLLQRAIELALKRLADIICLALDSPWDWTLITKDENRMEAASLQDALRYAESKGVPIFCPRDCMMSTYRGVTGIGAPEISKDRYKWASSSETAMFLFPGALEEKPSESPDDQSLPETSFATGLATGVAAALLQLQNIDGLRMGTASEHKLVEEGFKYLASGGRVVQIWRLAEMLRRITPDVQNGNGDVVENMRREIRQILRQMVEDKER